MFRTVKSVKSDKLIILIFRAVVTQWYQYLRLSVIGFRWKGVNSQLPESNFIKKFCVSKKSYNDDWMVDHTKKFKKY